MAIGMVSAAACVIAVAGRVTAEPHNATVGRSYEDASGPAVVCWRQNGGRASVVAVSLNGKRARTLYTARPGFALDFVVGPAGDRVAVIEWSELSLYSARVYLLSVRGRRITPLEGPKTYPAMPVWLDATHLAVLRDGVLPVVMDVRSREVRMLRRIAGTRLSKDPAALSGVLQQQEAYARRIGLGARLDATRHLLRSTNAQLGIPGWYQSVTGGILRQESRRIRNEAIANDLTRATLRSVGLAQYPEPRLRIPGRPPALVNQPSLVLSPGGQWLAFAAPSDPRRVETGGFVVGMMRRDGGRSIRYPAGDISPDQLHWSADGRSVVYSVLAQDPAASKVHCISLDRPGITLIGPGENGYLVTSGPR